MTDTPPPPSTRSRYGNVVHTDDVPPEVWRDPTGTFAVSSRELAVALGAAALGYNLATLAPGARSCPFHFHHSEEELFFVLSGAATLRQGDGSGDEERVALRAGDVVAFPAGTGVAHQFVNDSDQPFVYLAVSNRVASDVVEYPDSDKILVRGPRRRMLRREPQLEYLDGETSSSG